MEWNFEGKNGGTRKDEEEWLLSGVCLFSRSDQLFLLLVCLLTCCPQPIVHQLPFDHSYQQPCHDMRVTTVCLKKVGWMAKQAPPPWRREAAAKTLSKSAAKGRLDRAWRSWDFDPILMKIPSYRELGEALRKPINPLFWNLVSVECNPLVMFQLYNILELLRIM